MEAPRTIQGEVISIPAPASPPSTTLYRIDAIDLLRGLVMVIMALDHTRDLFHVTAFTDDPLNLQTTTPWLYFTRWITHFCAPVFVFLAGTSIYLQGLRKTKSGLSSFLLRRGLWLIGIELVVVTFGLTFDLTFSTLILQVIWAIGISMVLLALAVRLPFAAVLGLGLAIVFGHNLLDYAETARQGNVPFLWNLLHRQGVVPLGDGRALQVFYPFLPWTGLMLLGYCLGRLFAPGIHPAYRRKALTGLGLGAIALFLVLRAMNDYGDPLHWTGQKNTLYTALSFINTQKYPPSLLFLCMTIGPALLFLAWVGSVRNRLTRIITVYGRVPFFYYVLHFYLLHGLSALLFLARGHSVSEGVNNSVFIKFIVPGEGVELWAVYLVWLAVIAALYPLCKWYSHYKATHRQWWLSYL